MIKTVLWRDGGAFLQRQIAGQETDSSDFKERGANTVGISTNDGLPCMTADETGFPTLAGG